MTLLLAGCPPPWITSIHNGSGAPLRVVSSTGVLVVPAGGKVRLEDHAFDLDRDARRREALRLEGAFGVSCHALVYPHLGVRMEDLVDTARHRVWLLATPEGEVVVVPFSAEARGPSPHDGWRLWPRLDRCADGAAKD